MEEEKPLSSEESLAIITTMINKAKGDYDQAGISSLMWGSLVIFCSLVTFGNYWWKLDILNYIWFVTYAGVIPQIFLSVNEAKKKKYKTYNDDAFGGIWISFAIAIFLISYLVNVIPATTQIDAMYLVAYGIPTFSIGFAKRFAPMIIGGIACWVFAIVSLYIPFPYTMLLVTVSGLLAWFIPGLILRTRYLKAKHHV